MNIGDRVQIKIDVDLAGSDKKTLVLLEADIIDMSMELDEFGFINKGSYHLALIAPYNKYYATEKFWVGHSNFFSKWTKA